MPDGHVRAEASAMWLIRTEWAGRAPLDCPVGVDLEIVVNRPGRLTRKKDPHHRLLCVSKPDVDNVAKLILDAVVKAGVITDDTRVADLRVRKMYAAIGEMPHVRLTLFTL
jgi:Holliday junction resolvase RusA-like endonuclease